MRNLPPITKNLLIINCVVWLLDELLQRSGIYLVEWFGLFNWSYMAFSLHSTSFHIWQPLTYMFMHGNFEHLFCNMFAVWMFGSNLEQHWGSRRYLTYYLVCGVGAALVQELVWMLFMPGTISVTIGASGAVFGILFAFGWLFPNLPLYILFIPIPIRARVFVIIYAFIELFAGLANFSGDNVAHFAHLGGMLFGWLLLLWWQRKGYRESSRGKMGDSEWLRRIREWVNDKTHRSSGHQNKDKGGRDFSDYHYHPSED